MGTFVDDIAALLVSAAIVSVATAGLATILGTTRVRDHAIQGALGFVAALLGLRALAPFARRLAAEFGAYAGDAAEPSSLSLLWLPLVLLGHLTLALVLLARRLRPDAGARRAEAAARDRVRVRRAVPIRNEEVER